MSAFANSALLNPREVVFKVFLCSQSAFNPFRHSFLNVLVYSANAF